MSLATGARLNTDETLAPLATGGMGKMLSWTLDPRPDASAPPPGAPTATKPSEIRIVLNWIEELKAKVR